MGSGVTIRPSGPRNTRLAPPNTAGATLSGWPSSSLQSSASAAASSFSSSRAVAAAAPATVAAAEEPSPRATGMSESADRARPPGTCCPARRQAAAKPRYSRSASGAVSSVRSVPPRSIATASPAASRPARAVTRSQRPTATPTQSKPAPRLDVEPATRTVTLVRIPGLNSGNRKARAMPRRGRSPRLLRLYVDTYRARSTASRRIHGENPGRDSRCERHREPTNPAAARAPSTVHRDGAGGLRSLAGQTLRGGVHLAAAGRRAPYGGRARRPGPRAAPRVRPGVLGSAGRHRGLDRDPLCASRVPRDQQLVVPPHGRRRAAPGAGGEPGSPGAAHGPLGAGIHRDESQLLHRDDRARAGAPRRALRHRGGGRHDAP